MLVDEEPLVDICLQLIMTKTHEVFKASNFTSIQVKTLDKLLDCPNFSVSELEVFEACMTWVSETCQREKLDPIPANHRKVLGDTLYKIQIGNLSLDEFSQIVTPTGLLKQDEELAVFRLLTSPSYSTSTPFKTGRQNRLLMLKPIHLVRSTDGECNFDSETFSYKIQTLRPLKLVEIHIYDLLGPHIINFTISSQEDAAHGGKKDVEESFSEISHKHAYHERQYDVFAFKLQGGVSLHRAQYNISLTLIGEFDTMVYDTYQYGDKCLTVVRKNKDSPLFALAYTTEDENVSHNPLPPLMKGETSGAPPLPPRQPKHD